MEYVDYHGKEIKIFQKPFSSKEQKNILIFDYNKYQHLTRMCFKANWVQETHKTSSYIL